MKYNAKKLWYVCAVLLMVYGISGLMDRAGLLYPIEHFYRIFKIFFGAAIIIFVLILGKFGNVTWIELFKSKENRILGVLLCIGMIAIFLRILLA